MTRLFTLLVVLITFSPAAYAMELNGVCLGTKQLSALANSKMLQERPSTDKYRFEGGDVYHRYEGREEYLYNKVIVSPFNPFQYLSGNMRFVLNNKQSGYVVVGDNYSWKIIYLECAFK
jgi:hypothetical protein